VSEDLLIFPLCFRGFYFFILKKYEILALFKTKTDFLKRGDVFQNKKQKRQAQPKKNSKKSVES